MTIPAGVTKLVIEPFLETGTGKVWFDDVVLEEYDGITGLALDQTAVSMGVGESLTLGLTMTQADAADQTVVWSSSNPDAVAVDSAGKLSAIAARYGNDHGSHAGRKRQSAMPGERRIGRNRRSLPPIAVQMG